MATAWMIRRNRLASVSPEKNRHQELILWCSGAVATLIAYRSPPDVISQLLSAGLFSYIVVGLLLAVFKAPEAVSNTPANRSSSVWQAVMIGLVVKYAVVGLVTQMEAVSLIANGSYAQWLKKH
jgi:cytochrome c oxidase assembly factor CtaG